MASLSFECAEVGWTARRLCRCPHLTWFDESKAFFSDFRHRALRHHSEGIFLCERIFGHTITLSTCARCGETRDQHGYKQDMSAEICAFKTKQIPIRWIGEQHVLEDLGRIPTAADWLECITPAPWMNRSRKLSKELEQEVAA